MFNLRKKQDLMETSNTTILRKHGVFSFPPEQNRWRIPSALSLSLFLDKKVDLLLPLFFPSPFSPNLILSFQTRLCRKFTFFLLLPPPFLLLLLQWLHLLQCCTTTSAAAAAAAARSRLFAKGRPRRAARGKGGGGNFQGLFSQKQETFS